MKKIQNLLLGAAVIVAVVALVISGSAASRPIPSPQAGAQGLKGDKGDQGNQGVQGLRGLQGLQGPAGKDGKASLSSVASPDIASGYITLSYGAGIEGAWASTAIATNTVFAANPADTGLAATSTLIDAICHIDTATSTEGAVITFSKITSAYSSGFSTSSNTSNVELASTTVDLKASSASGKAGGVWISLASASSSILSDPDNSNFDPQQKELFVNQWNWRTDRLVVSIDAKNVDKNHTSDATQNFSGACAGFWRAAR